MSIDTYKKTVLVTTDRVQITLMLYDGALTHIKMAKKKIQSGDIISKGIHFTKATNIVSELSNVLDMERGGEIANNLRNLYDFVLRSLLHANLKNDVKSLESAEKVIQTIRDGWKEMMQKMKKPEHIKVGV